MLSAIAALALALAACLALAPTATGQQGDGDPSPVTAWWWRPQSELGLLPAPHVDERSLVVGQGAGGPTAIAAVRSAVTPHAEGVVITLDVDRVTATGTPGVDACVAAEAWTPTEAGAWDERPAAACDVGRAAGVVSDDGANWSFDVSTLASAGRVDIVLLPSTEVDSTGAPFEIVFAPPAADAVATETAAPSQRDAVGSTPGGVTTSSTAPTPPVAGVPAAAPPTSTLGASGEPLADSDAAPRANGVGPTAPVRPALDGRNRAVAVALIAATLASFAAVQRRQRSPVGVRGVARFVADRDGAPPPL